MYHSTATLLPDGRVLIAGAQQCSKNALMRSGSNPNRGVTTVSFPTEYRIEYISPPYLSMPRPTFSGLPGRLNYGNDVALSVALPSGTTAAQVSVSLMDLGFATHGVLMNQRAPMCRRRRLTRQAWSSSSALSPATEDPSRSLARRQLRSTRPGLRGSSSSPMAYPVSLSGACGSPAL